MNALNNVLIGPAIYTVCDHSFLVEAQRSLRRGYCILVLLLSQSVGYYFAHMAMHSSILYKTTHEFHHRYNTIIVPMAANAVTVYEYLIAYMFPIVFGIFICRPDSFSLKASVYAISYSNIVIHSPFIKKRLAGVYPRFLVSPFDHFDHHRRLKTNYSAPIFNLDWLWTLSK